MDDKPDGSSIVTVWNNPRERFQTQYGYISYSEWCMLEVARFAESGTRTKIVTNGSVMCIARCE